MYFRQNSSASSKNQVEGKQAILPMLENSNNFMFPTKDPRLPVKPAQQVISVLETCPLPDCWFHLLPALPPSLG